MKCVILAGGKGTRIAEESNTRPKPMVEIGSKPILWHIMKLYASHGVTEFGVLRQLLPSSGGCHLRYGRQSRRVS
jgi:glucose-1-phosphate cytidylyltransferase